MIATTQHFYFKHSKFNSVSWSRNIILMWILFQPGIAYCQSNDEIIVSVNVQRIGDVELPAIIHNDTAYLPVNLFFDFIKIKNTLSPDLASDEGFFIDPKATFKIDKKKNRIIYQDKIFDLNPGDLIQTETNLYLKSNYFGEIFGLQCAYSFRDLSISVSTTLELPAMIELRQMQMRKNINRLKGETKADTIIKRVFPMFHLGSADWMVNTMQETNAKNSTSLNLDIGAIIAGGETDLYLKYNSNIPLNLKDQDYHWRYVNNDNAVLRQVTFGKIFTQSTASLNAPVTGVQFTNTPTTYRKSYGTYRLSDKTEPGNIVELYINNVLIDYTRSDASGFYTFEIPLAYGNSSIQLRFYGISGEDHSREQYISIPFNFIPLHQLEYSFTSGIVDDDKKNRFVRGIINYGFTRQITLGTGVEYLSSVVRSKAMPFLSASMQATSNLLVSGEINYGVRSKGIISYRIPSKLQLDITYIKYDKGQTAIKNDYLEEKKAVLSMPLCGKFFKGMSRITVDQFVLPNYKNTNAEFLLSGVIWGVSSNLTTYAQFSKEIKLTIRPEVYSNLSFAFRLPKSLRITPQIKYQYDEQKLSMARCEVEKKIFSHGYMNFSYEKNITDRNQYISMALRYDFSFAKTSLSARQSNNIRAATLSLRGSFMYDEKTNYLEVSDQTNVGKGGIIILPFLDLNCNGRREPNEPKVAGLKFHINGGHTENNIKDTTFSVSGLEAYNDYFIELDKNSFENITWQIKNPIIKAAIEPNHFKLIEVPVAVVGEVSGAVYLVKKNAEGIGGIIINIYNEHSVLAGRTITEPDGFFSYMGLAPGKYIASIDTAQFQKLKYISSHPLSFKILSNKDGDIAEDLKFFCQDSLSFNCPVDKNGLLKDSDHDGVPDCIDKELITPASCFPVDADGVGKCIFHFKETL